MWTPQCYDCMLRIFVEKYANNIRQRTIISSTIDKEKEKE